MLASNLLDSRKPLAGFCFFSGVGVRGAYNGVDTQTYLIKENVPEKKCCCVVPAPLTMWCESQLARLTPAL